MARYTKKSREERIAQAKELQEVLTQKVQTFKDSEQWLQFLAFASSFHDYSFANLVLIYSQNPNATLVAGFRQWQKKGRQVRKGEKGIRIFGYSTKKIKNEEEDADDEEQTRIYYPLLTVFDISQTDPTDPEAADMSSPISRLTGDDLGIYDATSQWLTQRGWTVEREEMEGTLNGYTTTDGTQRVAVRADLAPAHAAKTILHEAAHVILHAELEQGEYVEHRGTYETEAESVAYVVANVLGLDTSTYSIGYVTSWSNGDVELIRTTASNVTKAAHTLMDALCEPNPDLVAA